MDKLNIKCGHLVCIPVGNGIMQHIIFKPTAQTVTDVMYAVVAEAKRLHITVDDVSGQHTTNNRHEFIRCRESYGTMILTTLELS